MGVAYTIRANGAVLQPVVQSIDFVGQTLLNEGILSSLGLTQSGHVQLILEANILALRLGQLVLDAIQFQSAELIDDSLSTTVLVVDDIASVLSRRSTIRTVLSCHGVLEVSGRGTVITTALSKLRLKRGHALSVSGLSSKGTFEIGNLVGVHLLGESILSTIDGSVHTGESTTERILHIAEARSHAVLKTGNTSLKSLVTEAVADMLAIVQPRIEIILAEAATHAAHHHGPHHTAAEAAPHTIATEQDEEDKPPAAVATKLTTKVAAVTISGHNGHVEESISVFRSHSEFAPFSLIIYTKPISAADRIVSIGSL